tara:strand:+ start:525 stop:1127 length:603 start_codon:yes stop_codon:yes gene_type:complete
MAWPTIDAPYGLKPVNLTGGTPFAGSTRQFAIASGYASNIFNGDVVKLVNTGYLERDAITTATTNTVGVFLGCTYTDPSTSQLTFQQYFPASTAASDIKAYVCDDPNALFKVVSCTAGGTTVTAVGQTALGNNIKLVNNAGSTVTGNSKVAMDSAVNTTNTFPMKIIDVVQDTKLANGNFVEFIVKWNFGMHQYDKALGV